jgi:uncharacterized membrane protein
LAAVSTLQAAKARSEGLDSLRGIAIIAMMAYHFAFDLQYFKLIDGDPYSSPIWRGLRTVILSSFLLISGLSFGLAQAHGRNLQGLVGRWVQIAICALLVSAGSYLMFPKSPILFGVLHAVCAMWIIAYYINNTLSTRYITVVISFCGIAMIAAGITLRFDLLSEPWLHWLGMAARRPRTEDYVPLLPWIGVFLLGLAASKTRALSFALNQPLRHPWLSALGRYSLSAYMLHQPLFIGSLWVFVKLVGKA